MDLALTEPMNGQSFGGDALVPATDEEIDSWLGSWAR